MGSDFPVPGPPRRCPATRPGLHPDDPVAGREQVGLQRRVTCLQSSMAKLTLLPLATPRWLPSMFPSGGRRGCALGEFAADLIGVTSVWAGQVLPPHRQEPRASVLSTLLGISITSSAAMDAARRTR